MLRQMSRLFDWLDSDNAHHDLRATQFELRTELDRWFPFIFLHLGCFLTLFTGSSQTSIITCVVLYFVRMFAITAFYHRYFSHRAFKTSRLMQLGFALLGASAVQRGPLWWAAHHRQHHSHSDENGDVHSPLVSGFLWSHIGWLTSSKNMPTDYSKVTDFGAYPELRLINRFDWIVPTALALTLLVGGNWLGESYPQLSTSGLQLLAWGFFVSTTLLFHATASINSVAHLLGYRNFQTDDNSRNNAILALLTLGEGWHNNHHKYSYAAKQGVKWWEIDITYVLLWVMERLKLISDLKASPPDRKRAKATMSGSSRNEVAS